MSVETYLRAIVAYDGTDFSGFQVQAARTGQLAAHPRCARNPVPVRTVQGALETALEQITGEPVRLLAAGRTDAGVHALGQVVAFATHWRHPLADLYRAWNAVLPDDIAILSMCQARRGFHPRFNAISRAYRYTLWNHPVRNPLLRRTALWVSQPLDVARMGAALDLIVGEHDFATFGAAPGRSNASGADPVRLYPPTVRRVVRASCTWMASIADGSHRTDEQAIPVQPELAARRPDGFHRTVYLDLEANAFLYRMVRSIVGTTLQVGMGKLSLAQFASLFAAADRSQAGPTAPPHGLCLIAVNYRSSNK